MIGRVLTFNEMEHFFLLFLVFIYFVQSKITGLNQLVCLDHPVALNNFNTFVNSYVLSRPLFPLCKLTCDN